MTVASRSTLIVHGRLAMRVGRLAAARDARHGLQIMTFEQAAVRLAGGFVHAIDTETLRATIQAVLPMTDMGELERIKMLPGMITAAVDSLRKVWHAGIDLASRWPRHLRLDAIARLESAVLARLPQGMLRPSDIVAAATARLGHSLAVMGTVEISGLTELEPCWRPLLKELATRVPVQWTAGPRAVPDWLKDSAVKVVSATAESPTIGVVSAATAYHEAIEALRWARALLAAGVTPSDIAIASASPAEYDDHFLALRADANLDLHFVHGVRTITTRDGQAAAALADLVVRGLARARLRRLAVLCKDAKPFKALPEGWLRVLPPDAPLTNLTAWERLLDRLKPKDWPDQNDHSAALRAAVRLLAQGATAAAELGEAFLDGRALAIWRKALLAGPAVAIDATLASLKHDDGLEACVSVAWMPASALAASPRPFVRLVGLNSSRWPRGISEDRLVPDHIIATAEIDPLPVNLADRRDFKTILATTAKEIVLSRARRDSEGRLLGRSALIAGHDNEVYLRRHAIPLHAFSETDRLMARSTEFALEAQAMSAMSCWRDWHHPEITAHDGLVRADHPLLLEVLHRRHSASSMKFLLRNSLGYLWRYAFHWEALKSGTEPLVLDALDFGDLVHRTLDLALRELETTGGLSVSDVAAITAAVQRGTENVVVAWESERAAPPGVIWRKTLEEVREVSVKALSFHNEVLPNARSYSEVPFGGLEPKSGAVAPWDTSAPVVIPGTDFQIGGYIDRLDVAADGSRALVRDYKTGNPPKKPIRLNGGSELQRCLYAFAVKALLGEHVAISASLLYSRADLDLQLDSPDAAMADITTYLRAVGTSFAGGAAIPGPDTASDYDDLTFALPANAGATYCKRKLPAVLARLADVAPLWDAE
jgi:hypothetical protein